MKAKNLFIAVLIAASGSLFSDGNSGEGLSFFGIKTNSRLVFGGPFLEFSKAGNQSLTTHGGHLGIGFGKKYFAGLYGLNTLADITRNLGGTIGEAKLRFSHFGIWGGYMYKTYRSMFLSVTLKGGPGNLSVFQDKYVTYNHKPEITINELDRKKVVQLTPSLDAGFRLLKWISITTSVGYRFVTGEGSDYINPKEFRSPVFSVSLLLGSFGYNY